MPVCTLRLRNTFELNLIFNFLFVSLSSNRLFIFPVLVYVVIVVGGV